MEGMSLRLPPVQEQCIFGWCVRDLDFKSMTNISEGSTKFDKTQCKSKQHIPRSFPSLNNMYGSGGNSSFVIQELIMQHFCVFQKVNLQNFSITWNKINNSSDLLISYPSITQTQIKHVLPMSFKFRVNLYIKLVVSKTRENLRLKTRYLKGLTIEQLFIISI